MLNIGTNQLYLVRLKWLLLSVLIFVGIGLKAQDPFHFVIGENQLAGVEIYSMIQSKDKNYWLASDEGIIKYDGYQFKKIPSVGLLGNSVFDFRQSVQGLFCKNLSGQIIQIKNDTAKVFYQIPDSIMSTDFDYFFDPSGVLHVLGQSFFKVTPNKKVVTIISYKELNGSFTNAFKWGHETYIFQKPGQPEMYMYRKGKILEQRIAIPKNKNNYSLVFLDNRPHLWNNSNGDLGIIKDLKYQPVISSWSKSKIPEATKYYNNKETFWLISPKNGAQVMDSSYKSIFNNNPIFEDQFISCVYQDQEGNYLLGTFGSGIIIIPDLNSVEIRLPKKTIKINKITSNEQDIIYAGTQNGQIYSIDHGNKVELLTKNDLGNVRYLKFLGANKSLLVNGVLTNLNNLDITRAPRLITGSIKDVEHYEGSNYIIALNTGVQLLNVADNMGPKYVSNFKERAYCANYNPATNTIYAGTIKGLKIGNEIQADYFTLDSTPLICNDIKIIKDEVYVATQAHGILVFSGKRLVRSYNLSNGLISNNVKQLKFKARRIYTATDKGFIILNGQGNILYTLTKADGISVNKIIDFEIVNNTLWIAYQNGFHPVQLDALKAFNFIPTISLTGVFINESLIDTFNSSFDHLSEKIRFELSSKVLKYRDDIRYQYILEGLENDWSENSYANNIIEYSSLRPGKYSFKVKAICRNNESALVSYSFEITKPFWKRWWFLTFCTSLVLLILWLVYKSQLKKELKETQLKNELMATKLTAIKSQMNPHFIFNSLNSIQDLVLQQDANNAYNYIGKFAKLVRTILHHSDLEYVEFDEEIDLLKLYLELEKLRFKNDFTYEIKTPHNTDIIIPPMLIQPFIENALKHGLLHKKGAKTLVLDFKINEETLTCSITDNGIGRAASKIINARQNKGHKSFTLQSMEHRFKILKESTKQEAGVLFKDLTLENGVGSGTVVTLTIPCKRKF